MLETLRNAWRVKEIRSKLLYTFLMLILFRLLSVVPVPGINTAAVKDAMGGFAALDLVNMMTGNAFAQMTIMAMGISPYINASIIMQLLTIAIPALERMQKEGGEEGKKKISQITRYVTVGLAALQAIGIIMGLNATTQGSEPIIMAGYNQFWGFAMIGIVMAGGTALAMWIGDRITKKGIGNGVSMLIFVGIISNLFGGIFHEISGIFNPAEGAGTTSHLFNLIVILVTTFVILAVVTWIDLSERRIPVQYAKRVVGRKMFGGQSTHIPLKIMSVGVLPLIFAYSFMSFPATIGAMFGPQNGFNLWWQQYMNQTSPWYILTVSLLIIAFTYFYSSITFNPADISKNIQQQGGNIPGIRSGANTVDYLKRTSHRLILFAALFLAVLSAVPTLTIGVLNVNIPFGGSSILIAVSVALEFIRQIEAHMTTRNYKGFM